MGDAAPRLEEFESTGGGWTSWQLQGAPRYLDMLKRLEVHLIPALDEPSKLTSGAHHDLWIYLMSLEDHEFLRQRMLPLEGGVLKHYGKWTDNELLLAQAAVRAALERGLQSYQPKNVKRELESQNREAHLRLVQAETRKLELLLLLRERGMEPAAVLEHLGSADAQQLRGALTAFEQGDAPATPPLPDMPRLPDPPRATPPVVAAAPDAGAAELRVQPARSERHGLGDLALGNGTLRAVNEFRRRRQRRRDDARSDANTHRAEKRRERRRRKVRRRRGTEEE